MTFRTFQRSILASSLAIACHGAYAMEPMRIGRDATLAFDAEARIRHVATRNDRLVPGAERAQVQFRGIAGADLRIGSHVRFRGELGTGQVDRDRDSAAPNVQNRISVQQLYADVRGTAGAMLLGATIGRQEFADGPRQLMSLGDGANLRRSWNGIRVYAQAPRYRIGAFELRATALGAGGFDDGIESRTVLRGANASVIVSRAGGPDTTLDPFWFHVETPGFRVGDAGGLDKRDTVGLRFRGRKGALGWDWTAATQRGRSLQDRRIDAWGVFAVQSLVLSERGWKPRLTSHVDIASGGPDDGSRLRTFHPLYASSSYLGESQFLGLRNLLLVAPGIALAPSPRTTLSFEYGRAHRFDTRDAAYAGGMRSYAGTAGLPGRHIGDLLRLSATWTPAPPLSVEFTVEHLAAGHVLRRAGLGSGTHVQFGATCRY